MGSGASIASTIDEESKRPLDASDVATPRGASALEEVKRLRQLLADSSQSNKGDGGSALGQRRASAGQYTHIALETAKRLSVSDFKPIGSTEGMTPDECASPLLPWARKNRKAKEIKTYALEDHLQMQFPMYCMKASTMMKQSQMRSFEDLMKDGELVEWDKSMGPVWFLSHQWTAFNEPDHSGTQLRTIQSIFKAMEEGKMKERFGSEAEWTHFTTKDSGAMEGVFLPVTHEDLVRESQEGYIWLDYSSVPQAPEAQENRLKAIESIPHYIDAATTFVALCPTIVHKELGHKCDYHTWRKRGWCRLEEQVNELKLFEFSNRPLPQFGPGATAWDVPRRPLMVLSPNQIICVDMFDHFYTLGQRAMTVMNGDFACCSLNHEKTFADGTVLQLPCDKDRIRPFCLQLWQRKSNHFEAGPPMVRHFFAWRYISHMYLMMANSPDDNEENNDDPELKTLDDVCQKYFIKEPEWPGMMTMSSGFPLGVMHGMVQKHGDHGQFGGKETVGDLLSFEENCAELEAKGQQLRDALALPGDKQYATHALQMMIAEGNLKMVKMLVEEHGADPTTPMSWAMCTGIDFAAGKGHCRVLEYLLQNGADKDINRKSNLSLIGAVDRAAKGGFLDALRLLVKHGAKVAGVKRRNGETPAHGAAMHGQIEMLKELKKLGVDLN